jgi:acyl carrier protein
VPIGVHGELCISGVGVARGYLNNEELTREKFVTCIFDDGCLMYRTGDLASWLPDGNIQFLGRLDNQIKIRGHRIELGEIESQLNTHSKVEKSVVIDRGEGIDKILVAYYISKESLDKDELREYLLKKLADYMIPVHFIHIDQFPLTKNGKIDKKALPKPEFSRNSKRFPPRNEVELQIAKIWAELLKIEVDEIGIHDNFFDLGGNSIKILKLTYSINETFDCDLTVAEIFDRNRIVDLAEYILSGRKDNFVEIEKEINESIQDRNEFLNMESLLN